jgi:hypothetical protein
MIYSLYFINNGATEGAYSPALDRNQCVVVFGGYGLFNKGILHHEFIRVFLIPYGSGHV